MPWDMVSPKGGLCMHHCEFNHCLLRAVPTMQRKLLPCLQTCCHTATVRSFHLIIEAQSVFQYYHNTIIFDAVELMRREWNNAVELNCNIWQTLSIIFGLCLQPHVFCSMTTLPGVPYEKEEHGGLKGTLTFIFWQCPQYPSHHGSGCEDTADVNNKLCL